jgi:hypothetical protein
MLLHSGAASLAKWLETATNSHAKSHRDELFIRVSHRQKTEQHTCYQASSHDCTIPGLSRVLGGASTGFAPSSWPATGLELGSNSFMATMPTATPSPRSLSSTQTSSEDIGSYYAYLRLTSVFSPHLFAVDLFGLLALLTSDSPHCFFSSNCSRITSCALHQRFAALVSHSKLPVGSVLWLKFANSVADTSPHHH